MRPLRDITGAARAISASNLDERLNLGDSYDEFGQLGATLNDLFARLKAAFDSQRHLVANASHELRTPLAAERTVLQVALADPAASADSLRSACQQVLELGEQQERLIDALLMLTVSRRGLLQRQAVDLADVTSRIVRDRSALAADHGVRVHTSLAPAVVAGDAPLVESLVANLVDNAGLGLAIVQSIAAAHGASLAARAGPDGGLDITATFRRSAQATAVARS